MKNTYSINGSVCTLTCHSNKFGKIDFVFDADDFNRVKCHSWRALKERKDSRNFRAMSSDIEGIYLHRLLLSFPDSIIDHINRDTKDNRKINLRECSHKLNSINRLNTKKVLPKGVYYGRNGQFRARIWINGKNVNLGCNFKTQEEAFDAFKKASKDLYGDFNPF